MITLKDLQTRWDKFICSAVESEYNHWQQPLDLNPVATDLINAVNLYIEELELEKKDKQTTASAAGRLNVYKP
jgi:hypothetical protein